MDTTQTSRDDFSFTEILVVMIITFLIMGLLLPLLRSQSDRGGRLMNCKNNQRQIVLGMMVYSNDQDQKWPVFTSNHSGRWVPADDPFLDPTATAIASLEFLSYATGGDLSPKTFSCPIKPNGSPLTPAAPVGNMTDVSSWAVQGPTQIGYAYDWSTPPNALSVRVVTADRDAQVHKGSVVMAAYADGHVGNITRIDTAFINRDANNDDIYSAVGDGPMNTPGEGSTTRAFVR